MRSQQQLIDVAGKFIPKIVKMIVKGNNGVKERRFYHN
jgi:hypothetical protein